MHLTDLTRSGNMIKKQFSGLCTWKLKRSISFSTDPAPKMVKTSGGGGGGGGTLYMT